MPLENTVLSARVREKQRSDSDVAELKELLAAERATIIKEHNLTRQRVQDAFRESKPPAWVPGAANWNSTVGMESDLDRQIAHKVELLIQLKSLPRTAAEPEMEHE
jgi:hypothetical protein